MTVPKPPWRPDLQHNQLSSLALGGPDDCGVLIPGTSLDQYGATRAKWFGAGPTAMTKVFPNLGKFATADLGFMVRWGVRAR